MMKRPLQFPGILYRIQWYEEEPEKIKGSSLDSKEAEFLELTPEGRECNCPF